MAAGDIRVKIEQMTLKPGQSAQIEFRYGTEDKRGEVDSRGDSIQMSWQEFWSQLSAGERTALTSIKDKMLVHIKSLDVTKFGGSLDL